ncbi:hypothetical protein [Streptomyces sp. NPDC059262]|uniref:hypothetical protein n=1 Tax=Streptomyces sp. NPDC059262 TaxID=3346797 RepID=UPI0036966BE3
MTGTAASIAQQDQEIPDIVAGLRATFDTGATRPAAWRRRQLRGLRSFLTNHTRAIEEALYDDLRKGRTESHLTEIGGVLAEIDHALRHLERWMKPRRAAVPMNMNRQRLASIPNPSGCA